jgi:SAM-dependent methyltransferase
MPIAVAIILLALGLVLFHYLYVANVKGAPFVPTPLPAVKRMLQLAQIKPGEIVIDIGCGDGRLVILADQLYHAQAIGFEVSPPIFLYTKLLHFFKRTKTRAKILFQDSRLVNLAEADVVVLFMMPAPLRDFWKKKFEVELKPDARVISYAFHIQGWNAAHQESAQREQNIGPIYVYRMNRT